MIVNNVVSLRGWSAVRRKETDVKGGTAVGRGGEGRERGNDRELSDQGLQNGNPDGGIFFFFAFACSATLRQDF